MKPKMAEIEDLLDVSSSPFLLILSARLARSWQDVSLCSSQWTGTQASKTCAEISYFDMDLKNNTMVL